MIEWQTVTCPVCGAADVQMTDLAHNGYAGDLSDLDAVKITFACQFHGHRFDLCIEPQEGGRTIIYRQDSGQREVQA
jgi:hypothetical protein